MLHLYYQVRLIKFSVVMYSNGSVVFKPWRLLASVQSTAYSSAFASTATSPTSLHHNARDDDEWKRAKPFKSVPGPGLLEVIRWFLPGGEYK